MLKPSDFCCYPNVTNDVGSYHDENVIALNIMTILSTTGNVWRKLDWIEYRSIKHATIFELVCFERISKYCVSPEYAAYYSQTWSNKKRKYLNKTRK